jgi:hypothetical protein
MLRIGVNRLGRDCSGGGLAKMLNKIKFYFLTGGGINFGTTWNVKPCTLVGGTYISKEMLP